MNSLNGGYAMIKYNSTQEELQIAYRSKKPVLCYDENRRAHWAVIEETATESVDEETQEPITIYEYSYRLIDEASGGATLEDIVDSQGNKRFVEGNGTPLSKEGLTISYCKWSLSGTHIMLVVAGIVAINTTIQDYGTEMMATFEIPEYISNKIYKTFTYYGTDVVCSKNTDFIQTNNAALTQRETYLIKENNTLKIGLKASFNASATNRPFRIQFDLLIDNE